MNLIHRLGTAASRALAVFLLGLAALAPQLASAQALTDYAENKIIDAVMRAQTLGAPATWYVALFTSACSDSAVGTEVTGGSYARASLAASLANWAGTQSAGSTVASSGTGGQTSNNSAITFSPNPSAGWGTVTHIGLMDSLTSGNMWVCVALGTSKTINSGDTVQFASGALTVTFQ
ncbi:MAG TPA: hypothetical protein P5024_11490 [Burkholderiaceae bacterium]|nr:hypothetical protein [Rubrivivax sp.]HRZ02171.1 hypothetical protein [Burkholderiaceae bacterium]HRZ59907.1 hypothetical protein [Rubrivivax sp.]